MGRRSAGVVALVMLAAQADAGGGRQAAYDAAQAAFDKQDWATAASGFASLLPAAPTKPLSRSEAVIASRYGSALTRLGRNAEARDWIARGIAALPAGDPLLGEAWYGAGEAARFGYDYPAALASYDKAIAAGATNDAATARRARIGRAITLLTIDPARAAADIDAALAEPSAQSAEKLWKAQIQDLRARAAMNGGDLPTAKKWIKLALENSGGLNTTMVTAFQAQIRGDAAIISQLMGDTEDTRYYLTFTGAGHMADMDWVGARTGDLPICEVDGVAPEDVVVVQFAILEDGTVGGVVPIYASRPGMIGATFAETLSGWRWNPESLKGVKSYWRGTLRLELRCRTRPDPAALASRVAVDAARWLKAQGRLPAEFPIDDRERWPALTTTEPIVAAVLGIRPAAHRRSRVTSIRSSRTRRPPRRRW